MKNLTRNIILMADHQKLENLIVQLSEGDHKQAISEYQRIFGELETINFIKANMDKILEHYISCTWGVCYNAKFKDLIQPYLDDVGLLDKVLRSSLIKNKPNVIVGRTGARIFERLISELRKCHDSKIRGYLKEEFEN